MEWGTCTILGYGRNEQAYHPLWISPDQGDSVEPLEWFRCLRASNTDRTLGFHVGDYSSLVTCASVWTSVRTLGQGDSNERRRIQCPKSTSNLQIQRVSRVCEGISRNGNNSIQRLYINPRLSGKCDASEARRCLRCCRHRRSGAARPAIWHLLVLELFLQ